MPIETISPIAVNSVAHQPVLLAEVLEHLAIRADGYYVDGTFGRGGHSKAILARLGSKGRLLALDRDSEAIASGQYLAQMDSRLELVHAEFSKLDKLVQERGLVGQINGIVLDLGVSSPQIDTAVRGFSFTHDGPLDMRMNLLAEDMNAAQWLAQASAAEIADVLYEFGEERYARRIAKAIVAAREKSPIERTGQLAAIIAAAHPAWEKGKHPATRCFQAIRIHINQELAELTLGVNAAIEVLAVCGYLLVVSFHSLEDRIVKRMFKRGMRGDELPRGLPVLATAIHPRLRLPVSGVRPGQAEIDINPRARSAILRVAEKLQ